jgi:glycosyltransferase involved in cell wall biosynthesis
MEADLLFSGGQQTCLNAMLLGKPTIAVGHKWARDLIDDGEDGLIVDYGDVAGLRRAIVWVLEDPDRAAALAERGRAKAARFTTERTMRAVHELACGRPARSAGEGFAAARALPAPEEATR